MVEVSEYAYQVKAHEVEPPHEVRDAELLENLLLSMEAGGWQGAPLVKYDQCLLTGSHRYEAARQVGIEIPVVDLLDAFALDEEEVIDLVSSLDYWQVEVCHLAREADLDLAEALGIDWH